MQMSFSPHGHVCTGTETTESQKEGDSIAALLGCSPRKLPSMILSNKCDLFLEKKKHLKNIFPVKEIKIIILQEAAFDS